MSTNRTLLPGNRDITGDLNVRGDFTNSGDATISGSVTASSVSTTTGLQALQFTVALADFTDNEDATGTYEHTVDIPKGAVVTRTLITDVTGFTGDTSATITIGDGTDADRYNTGTPSVFTTATDIDAGAISGTVYHAAAATPTVIITSGSDFGSVTAGSVTITIFYYLA